MKFNQYPQKLFKTQTNERPASTIKCLKYNYIYRRGRRTQEYFGEQKSSICYFYTVYPPLPFFHSSPFMLFQLIYRHFIIDYSTRLYWDWPTNLLHLSMHKIYVALAGLFTCVLAQYIKYQWRSNFNEHSQHSRPAQADNACPLLRRTPRSVFLIYVIFIEHWVRGSWTVLHPPVSGDFTIHICYIYTCMSIHIVLVLSHASRSLYRIICFCCKYFLRAIHSTPDGHQNIRKPNAQVFAPRINPTQQRVH